MKGIKGKNKEGIRDKKTRKNGRKTRKNGQKTENFRGIFGKNRAINLCIRVGDCGKLLRASQFGWMAGFIGEKLASLGHVLNKTGECSCKPEKPAVEIYMDIGA